MLDKKFLVQEIITHLEKELVALKAAALATYEAATNEESKAENEYDTRGLEASYLAGAQAKRVTDIEELIYIYKELEVKSFTSEQPISSTALVEVQLKNRKSLVFIMSKGGGTVLNVKGVNVQIVTPISPLGEALLGLKVGDVAQIEAGDQIREYEILSVQ
jgi:transcription elongation GreA/GreB family factor